MNDELLDRVLAVTQELRLLQAAYATLREDAAERCQDASLPDERRDALDDAILASGSAAVLEGIIETLTTFWSPEDSHVE